MEQNETNRTFNDQAKISELPVSPISQNSISWEASEFVNYQKGVSWFIPLGVGAVALAAFVYFVTRDILSTFVMILAGFAFGALAHQKPRTLSYSVSDAGISIGSSKHPYDTFRSFSVVNEGALYYVLLEPLKRFMPPVTIYFAPDDGEKIFDILATHLPHLESNPDFVERLMNKIRF